jgi:hypothetical protein
LNKLLILAALPAALAAPAAAQAGEVFGGVYVHDVDTFLTKGGFEDGADLQVGWRGERITGLGAIGGPSPYAFASVNSAGDTNYAAAGLSWKIGGPLYVRPGIGIAIHDGPERRVRNGRRVDLGSRVLFEPELAVGYELNEQVSVEASWVHLSHAQLFSRQNAGMDNFGLRLNYRFR